MSELAHQIPEKLPAQTIVNSDPSMSAITLENGEELQIQKERSKHAVEKHIEKDVKGPQPQISPVEKSTNQNPAVVISSPSSNQYVLEYHSISPVNEIEFIIPEEFEFHNRKNLGVMMITKLLIGHDGGASEELKLLFDCLAPPTSQWKKRAVKRAMRYYPP